MTCEPCGQSASSPLPGLDPASIAAVQAGGTVVIEQSAPTPSPAIQPKAALTRPIDTLVEVTISFQMRALQNVLDDIEVDRIDDPNTPTDPFLFFDDRSDLADYILDNLEDVGFELAPGTVVIEKQVVLETIVD